MNGDKVTHQHTPTFHKGQRVRNMSDDGTITDPEPDLNGWVGVRWDVGIKQYLAPDLLTPLDLKDELPPFPDYWAMADEMGWLNFWNRAAAVRHANTRATAALALVPLVPDWDRAERLEKP